MNSYLQAAVTIPVTSEESLWLEQAHASIYRVILEPEEARNEDRALTESLLTPKDLDEFDYLGIDLYLQEGQILLGGEDHVNLVAMARLIQGFLKKFSKTEPIHFEWAHSASDLGADNFYGGAIIVTQSRIYSVNTQSWVEDTLKRIEAGLPPALGDSTE